MKNLFKIDWIQRILYVIGLVILVCVSFKDGVSMLNQQSSLGIKYWYFLIVPGFVLLFLIIFNNQYGWYSITSLYGLYFIWAIISITRGIKDKSEYFIATWLPNINCGGFNIAIGRISALPHKTNKRIRWYKPSR